MCFQDFPWVVAQIYAQHFNTFVVGLSAGVDDLRQEHTMDHLKGEPSFKRLKTKKKIKTLTWFLNSNIEMFLPRGSLKSIDINKSPVLWFQIDNSVFPKPMSLASDEIGKVLEYWKVFKFGHQLTFEALEIVNVVFGMREFSNTSQCPQIRGQTILA